MSALTPFLFENDGLIRVVQQDGEPWFVVADICAVLGIKNPRDAVVGLDADEYRSFNLRYSVDQAPEAGNPNVNIVSEGGLYTLILRSRKAMTPGTVAHRFRRWVTGELLPTIRKTGRYDPKREARPEPTVSVRELAAGTDDVARMIGRLQGERDPAQRRAVYAGLQSLAGRLGIPVPPLEELGRDAPPQPDILAPFWAGIRRMEEDAILRNHSISGKLLAINLNEVRAQLPAFAPDVRLGAELRRALKESTNPRFLGYKSVRSAISDQTIKCHVFEWE